MGLETQPAPYRLQWLTELVQRTWKFLERQQALWVKTEERKRSIQKSERLNPRTKTDDISKFRNDAVRDIEHDVVGIVDAISKATAGPLAESFKPENFDRTARFVEPGRADPFGVELSLDQLRQRQATDELAESAAVSKWTSVYSRSSLVDLRQAAHETTDARRYAQRAIVTREVAFRAESGNAEARRLKAELDTLLRMNPSPESEQGQALLAELRFLGGAVETSRDALKSGTIDRSPSMVSGWREEKLRLGGQAAEHFWHMHTNHLGQTMLRDSITGRPLGENPTPPFGAPVPPPGDEG